MLHRLSQNTVGKNLLLLQGIFAGALAVFGFGALLTLETMKVNGPVYKEIVLCKDLIADILPPPEYILETHLMVNRLAVTADPKEVAALTSRIETLKAQYDDRHAFWLKELPAGAMKRILVEDSYRPAVDYYAVAAKEFLPAVQAGDLRGASTVLEGKLHPLYEQHRVAIDQVVELQTAAGLTVEDGARSATTWAVVGLLVGAVVIVGGVFKLGSLIGGAVTQPLTQVLAQTDVLLSAAQRGQLDQRGDEASFHGPYRDLIHGINDIMGTLATREQQAEQARLRDEQARRDAEETVRFVAELSAVLKRVAGQDLTARITASYTPAHEATKLAFNDTLEHLADAFRSVAASATLVREAADAISAGGDTLAQGASEQASTLEEIAASLQELSTDAEHNAESAERVQGLSAKNRDAVVEGVASVERLTDAIQRIKASSDETSKIVKSIDEIAFQTNLLALNAAVEAARAGEAGRGFAVVAEEVRNLAQRSAEAARTTAHLIDGALGHAQQGVELNEQVLEQLGRIRSRVEEVTNAIGDVVHSSQNQRRGVSEVRVAVDQINIVTQQNAAHAEESAASAQDLLGQAEALRELVAGFTLEEQQRVRRRAA